MLALQQLCPAERFPVHSPHPPVPSHSELQIRYHLILSCQHPSDPSPHSVLKKAYLRNSAEPVTKRMTLFYPAQQYNRRRLAAQPGDEQPFSLCFLWLRAYFSCRLSEAATFCPDAPVQPQARYRHAVASRLHPRILTALTPLSLPLFIAAGAGSQLACGPVKPARAGTALCGTLHDRILGLHNQAWLSDPDRAGATTDNRARSAGPVTPGL